jgi:hypothetical protein
MILIIEGYLNGISWEQSLNLAKMARIEEVINLIGLGIHAPKLKTKILYHQL